MPKKQVVLLVINIILLVAMLVMAVLFCVYFVDFLVQFYKPIDRYTQRSRVVYIGIYLLWYNCFANIGGVACVCTCQSQA